MMDFYTPREAWEALRDRRQEYYDQYMAAFSGEHGALARTATPGSFWKRGGKVKLHVPAAADIAGTAASLLFGEEPRYAIYDESLGGTEEGSQQRLDAIVAGTGLNRKLLEAAEIGAAAGDVFLKCRYDREGADMPMIDVVAGPDALPEYRMDRLECMHFFTVLRAKRKSGKVWRVYERYEPGTIRTAVFCGDGTALGTEEPDLTEELGLEGETKVPEGLLLAAHIANLKPSRTWETGDKGRSDFEGLRDLLDSLDEIYTSWLRDIRLAKSRLIVPAEFLRRNPADLFREGSYTYDFDEDVETLVALDIGGDGVEMKITPSQFGIRAAEHAQTYESTLRAIVSMAGYSPQTFGLDIRGDIRSGTALRVMERRSLSTNAKKQSYWKTPLERFLTAVMKLDRALYGNDALHDDDSVRVELRDPAAGDLNETAGTVSLLRAARAASTETLVRMLHSDWSEKQVQEEAERIGRQDSDKER
ncbi:MAG: phage portal protein [Clostridia bacterium]|nr:phage portal protein [Clostridia bacterium]